MLRGLSPREGNWKPSCNISSIADTEIFKGNRKTARKYVQAAVNLGLVLSEPNAVRVDSGPDETGPHGNVYMITARGLEFLKCLGD